MHSSLGEELAALESSDDAQRRGYLLESLVARLFRQAHYDVFLNPQAAHPRQTDLLVRDGQATYLVETRWRAAPATSGDVDDLHSRLKRTPSEVEAIFVSVAGFTDEALAEIRSSRNERIVIPLDRNLLQYVVADPRELGPRLRAMRDSLIIQGTLSSEWDLPSAVATDLPVTSISIHDRSGSVLDHIVGLGSYSGLTFHRELTDIDWVAAPGHGVTCDLKLAAQSPTQLIGVLAALTEIGWAGSQGQWTITQSERIWHGSGPRSLARAIEDQEARLNRAGGNLHHTEEVFYIDQCDGGFYSLSARPLIHASRVWPVEMSFQLSGIPFDITRLRRLADELAPGTQPYFRPRSSDSVKTIHFSRDINLEVVASLTEIDPLDEPQLWVVGLVARNPFYSEPEELVELGVGPLDLGGRLDEHEFLICDLSSWHPLGEERDYRLRGLEVASTSDVAIVRPFADWDAGRGPLVVPQAK